MLQKIVKLLLEFYLFPIKANRKIRNFVREEVLKDTALHLSKPIKFLRKNKLFEKTPVILDIGGANGDSAAYFLKEIQGCKVYVFEANPASAEEIKNRFEKNQVKVFSMALSDRTGEIEFNVTDNLLSSSYKQIISNEQFQKVKTVKVPTQTLNAVMKSEREVSSIDILKIDVQGAESDVLRGAAETLKRVKIIITEQSVRSPYQNAAMYHEIDALIRNAGFELLDMIVTYRKNGLVLTEFDAIYINKNYSASLL